VKVFAYLLGLVAVLFFGLGALALPFALIYAMGVVGTGGREGVGELLFMLGAMTIAFVGGIGIWRAAVALHRGRSA
jgi:hypothetical protein